MNAKLIPVALLVLATTLLSACSSTDTRDAATDDRGSAARDRGQDGADLAAAGIVNEKCPILTDEDVDPTCTVSYQGKKVGLCCQGCVSKWYGLNDAEKAAKLAAVSVQSKP